MDSARRFADLFETIALITSVEGVYIDHRKLYKFASISNFRSTDSYTVFKFNLKTQIVLVQAFLAPNNSIHAHASDST